MGDGLGFPTVSLSSPTETVIHCGASQSLAVKVSGAGVDGHVGYVVRAPADGQRDRHRGGRLRTQLERVGPRMPLGQPQAVGQGRHPGVSGSSSSSIVTTTLASDTAPPCWIATSRPPGRRTPGWAPGSPSPWRRPPAAPVRPVATSSSCSMPG